MACPPPTRVESGYFTRFLGAMELSAEFGYTTGGSRHNPFAPYYRQTQSLSQCSLRGKGCYRTHPKRRESNPGITRASQSSLLAQDNIEAIYKHYRSHI